MQKLAHHTIICFDPARQKIPVRLSNQQKRRPISLPRHLPRLRSDPKEHQVSTRPRVYITSASVTTTTVPIIMSSFLLNPYDATLNLVDKDDRKLFKEGSKGLKDKHIFDSKKVNYGNFVKLIESELNATRTMDALEVCTKWDTRATTVEEKRTPLEDNTVNIFKSNKTTSDEVKAHCNLV